MNTELRRAALACLAERDAQAKADTVQTLARRWNEGVLTLDEQAAIEEP
ncbi:MAG: DUF455 domain-containing protein, partial [Burkholderiaceae bacterium]|nr:DUF455 domain-containing protein [Burkholderiaceae bacterium]